MAATALQAEKAPGVTNVTFAKPLPLLGVDSKGESRESCPHHLVLTNDPSFKTFWLNSCTWADRCSCSQPPTEARPWGGEVVTVA